MVMDAGGSSLDGGGGRNGLAGASADSKGADSGAGDAGRPADGSGEADDASRWEPEPGTAGVVESGAG